MSMIGVYKGGRFPSPAADSVRLSRWERNFPMQIVVILSPYGRDARAKRGSEGPN